jgi:hypothetical protein
MICFQWKETMTRLFFIILFVLLSCTTAFAQTEFEGLFPGKSTRVAAERVLGRPVKQHSESLVEYQPTAELRPRVTKIYVQYRGGSQIVERIEVLLVPEITRADMIRSLHLPQQATASQTNARGVFEEYFGSPSCLVFTYSGEDSTSDVSRTGWYSSELFESAVAKVRPSQPKQGTQPASRTDSGGLQVLSSDLPDYMRPGSATSSTADRTGSTQTFGGSCFASNQRVGNPLRGVHHNWARQQQSSAALDDELKNRLNLLFRCSSKSKDQLVITFADISVQVAKYVPNARCFNDDSGVVVTDAPSHLAWALQRSRDEMLDNLEWKVSSALRCLDRNAQNNFFADVSLIIAKSGS